MDAGHDAVHWSIVGKADATDSEIMVFAAASDYVVLTNGLDFAAILASTHQKKPSVVDIRTLVPLPPPWHFNGAGIGFLQRSRKAQARYVAKALPSGELGKQGGNNPAADTTRRRIKKMLSKGLRSRSGWRGFFLPRQVVRRRAARHKVE